MRFLRIELAMAGQMENFILAGKKFRDDFHRFGLEKRASNPQPRRIEHARDFPGFALSAGQIIESTLGVAHNEHVVFPGLARMLAKLNRPELADEFYFFEEWPHTGRSAAPQQFPRIRG